MVERGDLVGVTTSSGSVVAMRALGAPRMDRSVDVVLVCTEDDWGHVVNGDLADNEAAIPWPLEDVTDLGGD